jgi:hypothetical protein
VRVCEESVRRSLHRDCLALETRHNLSQVTKKKKKHERVRARRFGSWMCVSQAPAKVRVQMTKRMSACVRERVRACAPFR